jgi:hypothetical protein
VQVEVESLEETAKNPPKEPQVETANEDQQETIETKDSSTKPDRRKKN